MNPHQVGVNRDPFAAIRLDLDIWLLATGDARMDLTCAPQILALVGE